MKKIGDSFGGIIGGLLLLIVGICLLWWNEGNNVKNLKTTAEMDKVCVDVKSDKVDSKNDGKCVATSGKLINEQELTDDTFNVTVKTPIMERVVEVYQWDEDSDTDDDGKTTYHYKKVWDEDLIDSSEFHKDGHDNPQQKKYDNKEFTSTDVKVGAFNLSDGQVKQLSTKGKFTDFNEETATNLELKISNNYLTTSEDLNNPQIGDIRISFVYNDSTEVSVLAVQKGTTFASFVSKAGKKVNRVTDGIHTGQDMITSIKKENKFLKWLFRILGTILCIAGFGAILGPISAIASFVPILGSLVDTAVGLVAFVLGLALSLLIIAIAWIRFRPVLGVILLAIVVALIAFLIINGKKLKNKVDKK